MGTYIIRRFIWMVVVLVAMSIITFMLMHSVPGGPFDRDKKLPPETIKNINAKYHLDQPLTTQYLTYMGNIVVPQIVAGTPDELDGSQLSDYLINIPIGSNSTFQWVNFGPSYKSTSRSVNDILRDNLPVSAMLGTLGVLVAILFGIPLGIIAALNQNKAGDYIATSLAITGVSFPSLSLGPALILIFGVTLNWVPVSGWGTPAQAILPAFAIGFGASALIARLTRASLLEVLTEDYVRTARAKGLHNRTVIALHAMKNAMIPVVTILGPLFAGLVTGAFVVETIFSIPGLGRYFVSSINDRDYPVIMGTTLVFATILVISNLIVDITYGWLDPRIRYS